MKQSNILLSLITAIYLRISREDDRDGESYSIENQKKLLIDYADKNGFPNVRVFIDDGVSGVTDKRKGFQEMITLVKEDKVGTILVKDMSRLGRNHLTVGEYVEYLFPTHDVRLIAVNDGVDTINGLDDFTPFRNIMNEWYSKDISRKRRSTNRTISKQGYAIGLPPYGYKRSENNPKLWSIDEEASEIVKHIYNLRLGGNSLPVITKMLRNEEILIPAVYAFIKGFRKPTNKVTRGNFFWNAPTVNKILKNQSYVGDVINFKTYSKSYKLKDRLENPKENWEVHKDVHEPIIEREIWEQVQRTFDNTKMRNPKNTQKHMLAGFLECSSCGKKLHHRHYIGAPHNDNFSCGNNRVSGKLCPQTHHIRIDTIMEATKQMIANITRFARDFEDEFVKIVVSEKYKQVKLSQDKTKRELDIFRGREGELDILFEQIYEDKIIGTLDEARFTKLAQKYEKEQAVLTKHIKELQKIVHKDNSHKMNVDGFLEMVRKYTAVNELTPEILRHYINKIVVHHRIEDTCTRTGKKNKTQEVEFHFNFIGQVKLPCIDEQKLYHRSFARNKKENQIAYAI